MPNLFISGFDYAEFLDNQQKKIFLLESKKYDGPDRRKAKEGRRTEEGQEETWKS